MTEQFGLAIVNQMNLITYAYVKNRHLKKELDLDPGPQLRIEILLKRSG